MIGHDDVGMQQVAGAVVVDGCEEEFGVALDLKESAAVVGGCGDEVRARFGGAARDRHSAIVSVPQRLKPLFSSDCCGTAEAVPLSKAVRAKLGCPFMQSTLEIGQFGFLALGENEMFAEDISTLEISSSEKFDWAFVPTS